ncbi:MAG TPA: hypothetical protein PLX06_08020 [Fimbriimonadaceae bacterium]|mgnify:CR=1 FL=1|nr:hypothetical protein [Fimbriimonadaceae bacterium]
MSRTTAALGIAASLWIAGGFQQTLAPRLQVLGASPDFLLVLLAAGSLFLNRAQGSWLGFGCGIVHGALAGANLTHYVISRCMGGFLAGWSRTTTLEPNFGLAAGTAFFLTLFSQVLFMFLAPPREIGPYLGATMIAAVYNGVLVLPVYFLLKRALGPRA